MCVCNLVTERGREGGWVVVWSYSKEGERERGRTDTEKGKEDEKRGQEDMRLKGGKQGRAFGWKNQ